MDIFDRAQDLLDKAQEKVADATTLAAWKANQTVRVKTVQGQRTEIEKQIETVTLQLGNRIYQLWKDRGGRDDPKIEELCRALDSLLGRYREINAELSELNRATYEGVAVGPRSAGLPGTMAVLPPSAGDATMAHAVPPASQPKQDYVNPQEMPRQISAPAPAAIAAEPPVASQRPSAAPSPAAPPVAAAPAAPAPRPARPKPCPSCGTIVPAEETYCPHCGYMAR